MAVEIPLWFSRDMARTHGTSPTTPRGDDRRRALLAALKELLREHPFHDIEISHISQRAGVARSGFYFYFPTKGAAVAVLLESLFEQIMVSGTDWLARHDSQQAERFSGSMATHVALWDEHAHLLVAMFDAAGSDPDVRGSWDGWLDVQVDRLTEQIELERELGLAEPGVHAGTTAMLLLGMNVRALERHVRAVVAGDPPAPELPAALAEVWVRTIYGA